MVLLQVLRWGSGSSVFRSSCHQSSPQGSSKGKQMGSMILQFAIISPGKTLFSPMLTRSSEMALRELLWLT